MGLVGTSWILESGVVRGTDIAIVRGREPTLRVAEEDAPDEIAIDGWTGCNEFALGWKIQSDGSQTPLTNYGGVTDSNCEPDVALQQELVLAVLTPDSEASGNPSELRFTYQGDSLVFRPATDAEPQQ